MKLCGAGTGCGLVFAPFFWRSCVEPSRVYNWL